VADEPDDAEVELAGFEKAKAAFEKILRSPLAERENLLRLFVLDLKKSHPVTAKMLAQLGRDRPRLLFAGFKSAIESTLVRPDLSEDEKSEALENAAEFIPILLTIRDAPQLSVPSGAAVEFAMSALLVGMYSGLRPKEIDKFLRAKQSDRGRQNRKKAAGKKRDLDDPRRRAREGGPSGTPQIQSRTTRGCDQGKVDCGM